MINKKTKQEKQKMNNKMVNQMIVERLEQVVKNISGHGYKSPRLIKKVGLALSVLTSDKGSLSYSDLTN